MNLIPKQLWGVVLLVFFAKEVHSQAVTTVSAQISGTSIQIIYQMGGLQNGQKFHIRLYSSKDNYTDPITDGIDGALGEDLTLTFQNIINIPDPIETLGFVTSDISFKVVATMTYNPIILRSPTEFFTIKKGKTLEISWTGGLAGEQVNFDLYKNGNRISKDIHVTTNQQSTSFKIPKLEKGPGYNFEFYMASEPQPIRLPDFTVKSKKGWIGLLIVTVGAYVYWDFSNEGPIWNIFNDLPPKELPPPPNDLPPGLSFKF